ncbi:glycerol-3-phosphate 1-O-acyltransferase PlsY [Candidatus Pelagibacter bacterium]|nr:glycerol-3-phosphate 1-O-acyltransferase PlsY [Candidatus Pelagibacter bacterium]
MEINLIIVTLYSYFLGSIPFGFILTKIFLKQDIRETGSGNIGATNVLRTGNKFLAILTLVLDFLKGYITIILTLKYFNDLILLSALICLLGHIFSIWLKFKGGKGVATYLGILLALSVNYFLIFIIVWVSILLIFKYSSLSSILATFGIFIYEYFFLENNILSFLFISFIIILYAHRSNILKLINKTETKVF